MDLRLFLSTFALVFLAELGDKTQLAAMAASAGSRSTWSVFFGASCALVLSTLIAVLVGDTLQRLVAPHVLKIGAALLFFIFGGFLLWSALHKEAPPAGAPKAVSLKPGMLANVVLEIAEAFETASHEDYARMAAVADSEQLRRLFTHLAAEEQAHRSHLRELIAEHGQTVWAPGRHVLPTIAAAQPVADATAVAAIDAAITHERNTVAFYRAVAAKTLIASVKAVFSMLADEEASHVAHLVEFKRQGTFSHEV